MARIAGINIPDNKHARVSLTYIFGIGPSTAAKICDAAGVRPDEKIGELDEANLDAIRNEVAKCTVEGDLRREKFNEHQTIDGSGLLSRYTSSPAPASAWPAYTNQCANP